jgi:hypothetical protein
MPEHYGFFLGNRGTGAMENYEAENKDETRTGGWRLDGEYSGSGEWETEIA